LGVSHLIVVEEHVQLFITPKEGQDRVPENICKVYDCTKRDEDPKR
jgi:hypothetical protein